MSFKLLKSLGLLSLIGIVAALLSCGSDDQFTNKLVAQPFVSKLFGQTTKTIALSTNEGDQIAWMGLEWSGDFKMFQIEQFNGNAEKQISSTTVFQNISVNSSLPPYKNEKGTQFNINGPLNITITYKPAKAIVAEDKPHKAYLLIAYEKPNLGIVRVELLGYTKGIRITKCTRPPSLMEAIPYRLVNDELKLYVCDSVAVKGADLNDPDGRPFTNFAHVPVEQNFVFYQLDNETVCFLDDKPNKIAPTIPDFEIPVPQNSSPPPPVEKLKVNLPDNFAGECELNDGQMLCNQTINLEVFGGQVPLSGLLITNGKTTPISRDCSSFEELEGSGKFNDASENLKLIAWGEIGSNNPQVNTFHIDGGLVVAIIELELP